MPNYLLLTLFSMLASAGALFSQNDEKSLIIGSPNSVEQAANIVADAAGNTYVGGVQDNKGLIVKQDASHQTVWGKTLAFTTNATDVVTITFLDLVGDTVFGCGTVRQQNLNKAIYFKLDAQTGNPYWSKIDLTSTGIFSCMRYANGSFFLVGAFHQSSAQSMLAKVVAVSSQTGNLVWETPLKRGELPGALIPSGINNILLNATEVYNGKFYVTGYCSPASENGGTTAGATSMPLLLGIHVNGTVFMEKWLSLPHLDTWTHYHGQKIHLDADRNLVIGTYHLGATTHDNLVVTKCDTMGNLLFSKGYKVDNVYTMSSVDALHEIPGSYVLFGTLLTVANGLYTLEIDKNGNLLRSILIDKPNTACFSMGGQGLIFWGVGASILPGGIVSGNSSFINGKHYFVSSEAPLSNASEYDINKIILNEDLDLVEDCSELQEIPTPLHDIPTAITPLPVTNFPNALVIQNGGIFENLILSDYCFNTSIDLAENLGCGESEITATINGFTDAVFYWSDGTVGSAHAITVNTTDTVFVRVLDIKCCELMDTILPTLVPSAFAMNLPADTVVCLQTGASFTIVPTISGAIGTVNYLWSNNATGTSLSVSTSGTYWVEISDSCFTLRDSIVVTMTGLPVIGNTGNMTVCENAFPVSLTPTVSAGATVLWDDGTTTTGRSVNGPGTYTVSATNGCGTVNASMLVSQTDLPGISLVSSIDTCIPTGGTIILSPLLTATNSILWSNGSTANQLTVSSSGTYTVFASNGCGTDSASVTVVLKSLPVIGNTANVTVCEGNFPATLNPTVSAGATVLWDDSTTTVNRSVNGPGTYTISATNDCGTVNSAMVVSQTDLPTVQLEPLIDTCIQNGTLIILSPIFTGTTSVLWSNGSSGNQLPVLNSGVYTVYTSNVCGVDSVSSVVTINHFPELDLPATLDTCFEIGVGFAYTAPGSAGSYQWSSGSNTATEWISQEGMYTCTLTNQCGSVSESMQVRRLTAVDLYFPNDSIKECSKQFAVSNLQIETNYHLELFGPDENLVGNYLTESGWYQVHAFNACGEKWDSIYVNLQNEQFFYLPNSFTPNNDGHNDRFEFKGENIVLRDVRIFNRWGEEIFTENGAFTGWDGTYRGETCPDGIYAVHLIYEDCFGIPTEFSGHVNLIR